MRPKGQIRVITLACVAYACAVCSEAYAQSQAAIIVAQANTSSLTIEAGTHNPSGTIDVIDDIQNLNALQISLLPVAEAVPIDTVTIGLGAAPLEDFDNPLGDDGLVDFVRVRLVADTNGNGIHDSDEPVLGVQEAEDFEDGEPVTVDFMFSPPLIIAPGLATTWLVTIDINSGDRAARGPSGHPTVSPWSRLGWTVLSLTMLAALLYKSHSQPASWRSMIVVLCLICGIVLWGCENDDDDDAFVFVVNLPRNGLTYQTIRLGPETEIPGATISLTES